MFDGRIYNVLTMNSTVRQIVNTIREFVPELEIFSTDNQILNQLSYEVSCDRFMQKGFKFEGNIRRGIDETIAWLGKANVGVKKLGTS